MNPKLLKSLLLLIPASFFTSCKTTTGGYFQDRLNDFIDIVPFDVAAGPGFYVGARGTAFAGVGIGYDKVRRAGWHHRTANATEASDLRGFKSWRETEAGLVVLWTRSDDPTKGAGNVGFIVPVQPEKTPLSFRPGLELGSALDAEVTIHLGFVGLRIGASPLQAIDWLLGWTTLDILNDDLNARFYNTKEEADEEDEEYESAREKKSNERKKELEKEKSGKRRAEAR
ncbi:MAG: hypothetical protein HY286_09635 [Planctomycetes bacterium]|nr:hypothetical protein [Planctomycetota bacterium]